MVQDNNGPGAYLTIFFKVINGPRPCGPGP